MIQFDLSFIIQLGSIIWFDLTYTAQILIAVSDLTQLFLFNFNHRLQFKYNQFTYLI